jgi:hypothetical protein
MKVTRTLLAPSEVEATEMASRAFSLVAELGHDAKPILESEFGATVVLRHGKAYFRREEFFNTGGTLVEVWHPSLPKPLGTCDHGKFSAWSCGEDAFYQIPEEKKAEFHLAYPDQINFLCPKHAQPYLQ